MSRDLRNTSLSAQAAQLKRTLENRDKRRQADKMARHAGKDDENEPMPVSSTAMPSQSVAALAAISGQHSDQPVLRCDLCQANFLAEAAYQQHLQSNVHRKALEKQQQEDARQLRLQQSGLQGVTAMALGAAGWAGTHGTGPGRGHGGPAPSSRHPDRGGHAKNRLLHRQGDPSAQKSTKDIMTHEEMTAALRAGDEVLSIDGWVPPSVSLPSAHRASTSKPDAAPPPAPPVSAAPPAQQPNTAIPEHPQGQGLAEPPGASDTDAVATKQDAVEPESQKQGSATNDPSVGNNALGLGYSDGDSDSDSSSSSSEPSEGAGGDGEGQGRSFF